MTSIEIKQNLIPKQVYIGDNAQLLCSFNSNSAVLTALLGEKERISLSAENFVQSLNYNDYDIKEISLSRAGLDYYNLNISFVPWRTGLISLPDYRLISDLLENQEIVISFEPFSIVSLTEEEGITSIRDIEAPLLLPGTIYKLYAGIILTLILLIIAIRLIVKHKKVARFFRNLIILRKYKANKKKAIKQLNALCKKKEADKESQLSDAYFAENIQKILRKYLDFRFAFPFSKTVTSRMQEEFNRIFEASSELQKLQACKNICAAFEKTDFIRYSPDYRFEEKELLPFIQQLIMDIETIEKIEKADKNEEKAESEKAAKNDQAAEEDKNA